MQRRKKLIYWRIDNRLKQKHIAEKLGITMAHYSNIERGISNPSYELMEKFRDAYEIKNIFELFEKGEDSWQQ